MDAEESSNRPFPNLCRVFGVCLVDCNAICIQFREECPGGGLGLESRQMVALGTLGVWPFHPQSDQRHAFGGNIDVWTTRLTSCTIHEENGEWAPEWWDSTCVRSATGWGDANGSRWPFISPKQCARCKERCGMNTSLVGRHMNAVLFCFVAARLRPLGHLGLTTMP